jgi:hypothetical protein
VGIEGVGPGLTVGRQVPPRRKPQPLSIFKLDAPGFHGTSLFIEAGIEKIGKKKWFRRGITILAPMRIKGPMRPMIPILPIAPIISMASISPLPAVDFFPPPQLNSEIVPIKSNTNPPPFFSTDSSSLRSE